MLSIFISFWITFLEQPSNPRWSARSVAFVNFLSVHPSSRCRYCFTGCICQYTPMRTECSLVQKQTQKQLCKYGKIMRTNTCPVKLHAFIVHTLFLLFFLSDAMFANTLNWAHSPCSLTIDPFLSMPVLENLKYFPCMDHTYFLVTKWTDSAVLYCPSS